MGRGIITASRTACLRAEQEVASRGEKCARLFQSGRKSRKIDSATPPTRCLSVLYVSSHPDNVLHKYSRILYSQVRAVGSAALAALASVRAV